MDLNVMSSDEGITARGAPRSTWIGKIPEEAGLLLIMLGIAVVLALLSPFFLTFPNLVNVVKANANFEKETLEKVVQARSQVAGLKVDKSRAQKIVTLLLRDKMLVKVSDELVFHRSALEQLRRLVAAQKTKSLKMDVATFKELTGVSRKYAIPLLEYLDRERVTKRVGDAREIL